MRASGIIIRNRCTDKWRTKWSRFKFKTSTFKQIVIWKICMEASEWKISRCWLFRIQKSQIQIMSLIWAVKLRAEKIWINPNKCWTQNRDHFKSNRNSNIWIMLIKMVQFIIRRRIHSDKPASVGHWPSRHTQALWWDALPRCKSWEAYMNSIFSRH